jgi:hypothetical protein
MKRFLATFRLTPAEQRAVIFVIVALLAWTWLKYQREVKRETAASFSSATPDASTAPEHARNR